MCLNLQPDQVIQFQDQGRSEKQNILEGELLVKVPGSAYSVGIATGTGNEILEEPEA